MEATKSQTFIKICGITRLSDARVAIKAGANAVGFLFAPSPRRVSTSQAALISSHVHPAVRKFGVFVDAPLERILETVDAANLDSVQLQGNETPEQVSQVKSASPRLFVTKVVRAKNKAAIEMANEYEADAVMFDRKDPKDPLSPSKPLPPSWFEGISLPAFVLAGGLTPANVARLVRALHPWGVDVSSGVEESPGRKDPEKVRAFVRAVRKAESI